MATFRKNTQAEALDLMAKRGKVKIEAKRFNMDPQKVQDDKKTTARKALEDAFVKKGNRKK